jgi:hypothetical protein
MKGFEKDLIVTLQGKRKFWKLNHDSIKRISTVIPTLKHNVMTTRNGMEVKLHALFSALRGSEWSFSHYSRLHPGKDPQVLNRYEVWWAKIDLDATVKGNTSSPSGNQIHGTLTLKLIWKNAEPFRLFDLCHFITYQNICFMGWMPKQISSQLQKILFPFEVH